jgi:hypothetical protein
MTSLDLRKTPVTDPGKEGELKSAFDMLEEVEAYLEQKLGVHEYRQPKMKPPPDLGEGLAERADALTNQELGTLHAQYVAYAAFLNSRLARIRAAYKVADSNVDQITADLSTKLYSKHVPKGETAHRVKIDPLYRKFELEYLKLYMMQTILAARYEAYDSQAKAISRLITLRTEELGTQRMNVQSRRPARRPPAGRF